VLAVQNVSIVKVKFVLGADAGSNMTG